MPRIKLDSHGFQTYTGNLGGVEFVDGVSTEPVATRDAHRMGAICRVLDADTEETINADKAFNALARPKRNAGSRGQTVEPENAEPENAEPENAEPENAEPENAEPENAEPVTYTEAQLADVADSEGMEGLRKIAAPMGVKANSIAALIKKILDKQEA